MNVYISIWGTKTIRIVTPTWGADGTQKAKIFTNSGIQKGKTLRDTYTHS